MQRRLFTSFLAGLLLLGTNLRALAETKPVGEEGLRLAYTRLGCYRRILQDIEEVQGLLRKSSLGKEAQDEAYAELYQALNELNKSPFPESVEFFRAVVPLNELHRKVFRVYSRILRADGTEPISIWHTHPYEMLSMFVKPQGPVPELKMAMMHGERRAEVINITNASEEEKVVRLQIEGLPGGTNPQYVKVCQVEYVDTREGKVVASALVAMKQDKGMYVTTVPAGMTRQIWLSVEPRDVEPGTYSGQVIVNCDSLQEKIGLQLSIAPINFPEQPSCSMGMWDYVASEEYAITTENQQAAIADLMDHFVDTAWFTKLQLPLPSDAFEDQENPQTKIDFSQWDEAVKLFPKARYYFVFANFEDRQSFRGKELGGKECEQAIAEWARQWAEHNRQIGLRPGQVGVLFIDEPRRAQEFKKTYLLVKAFKAGTDEIQVYCDPVGFPPDYEYGQKVMELCDVICPHRGHYVSHGDRGRNYYRKLKAQGKTLGFYICFGSTRFFNPGYYRLQPWHCFAAGASSSSFWAYADAVGANSWNEYPAINTRRPNYSPVYIAPDSITTSKHWEAAREGIQDYEYLKMLQDLVVELKENSGNRDLLREAEQMQKTIAESVVDEVYKTFGPDYYKESVKNPSAIADRARVEILRLLTQARLQSQI